MQFDSSAFVADPELFDALKERSTPLGRDFDQALFQQGQEAVGLYLVEKGPATLSIHNAEGTPIVTLDAGAGALLGLPDLLGKYPHSMSAIAHRGARVSFVTRTDFNALMESNPRLSLMMLQLLAAEVRAARRALY